MPRLHGSGYASVFHEVDLHGEVVRWGAFRATIEKWKASQLRGEPLPLRLNHVRTEKGRIGDVVNMAEDDFGLLVEFELFSGARGERIAEDIESGILAGLSIGANSAKRYPAIAAEDRARGIKAALGKIDLGEISLTDVQACDGARVHTFEGRTVLQTKYIGCPLPAPRARRSTMPYAAYSAARFKSMRGA